MKPNTQFLFIVSLLLVVLSNQQDTPWTGIPSAVVGLMVMFFAVRSWVKEKP